MKKNQCLTAYFLSLFVLFTIHAAGQPSRHDEYRIEGTITGIDSGTVRMFSRSGNRVLDSAVMVKGKFSMQGRLEEPGQLRFNIAPGNWNFLAFVEAAPIKLRIDTAGARHYDRTEQGGDKWALIHQIEQTGSEIADVFSKNLRETRWDYYGSVFSSLQQKLKAYRGDEAAAARVGQEMDSVRNVYLAGQKRWIEAYISRFPSSVAGVYLLSEYYSSLPGTSLLYLDSLLAQFSGPARSSAYYKELAGMASRLRNRQPGSPAPDFTLRKRDGSPFALSSTRGSYTLVDFWASWCVPCRRAIPAWKKVYTKYKDKGLTILSVSVDRNSDDWTEALDKEQMPWEQVIDEYPGEDSPARVGALFAVAQYPFYLLLDKEGKVILASGEEDMVRKRIEELFPVVFPGVTTSGPLDSIADSSVKD